MLQVRYLLAVFFCEGDRVLLRAALFSRDLDRDLDKDPLELQELLRWPVLRDTLFFLSELCLECLIGDSELLFGLPRWCLSFTLEDQSIKPPITMLSQHTTAWHKD